MEHAAWLPLTFHGFSSVGNKKRELILSAPSEKTFLYKGLRLAEVTLQQALQSLAVTGRAANPSDSVPVAGIARAFRTAFGTSSSGRACVAVLVQLNAFCAIS